MKILTVVGARPQFIKAAAVSRAIATWNREHPDRVIDEIIAHTGQHFDYNMSQTFFDELSIPQPKYNLDIHGGSHGQMTGRMLEQIEALLLTEKPDWVLIYGDTNSTLAGALAAVKLHIPVAHVEAGLRSFNMRMPEEVNRIVADRVSTLLLCPTDQAVRNLAAEGVQKGVFNVGDVMYDVALFYGKDAERRSDALARLDVQPGNFILATCHRAENTDNLQRMKEIVSALSTLSETIPVVLPIHPRTRNILEQQGLTFAPTVKLCEPLPFLDMVLLERSARVIVTDSGGVQKEAYFYGVPCVTMRDETEWIETVGAGWNRLTGASAALIVAAVKDYMGATLKEREPLYGNGDASRKVIEALFAR